MINSKFKFVLLILLGVLFLLPGVSFGAEGDLVWERALDLSGNWDVPTGIAVDSTGVYLSGYQNGYSFWRVEKRSLVDGSLIWEKVMNYSGDSEAALCIDVSSDGVYIGGGTHQSLRWRVEKRSLVDGSLIWERAVDLGGGTQTALAITVGSTGVYSSGYQNNGGLWRVEKRSLVDGSLIWEKAVDLSGAWDWARAITVDSTGVYSAGYQNNSQLWRVEKRSLVDGSLIWEKAVDFGAGAESAGNLNFYSGSLYIVGAQAAGDIWRVEKRSPADGSLIWEKAEDLTSGNDGASEVAVNSTGIYSAGTQNGPNIWRVEKRIKVPAPPPSPPCEYHNVWGWAWSSNIGWISFSCENCDSDLDGFVDAVCDPATPPSVDYGVDVDSVTGLFSGYVWSDNIGWISFEPADVNVADCPDWPASCQAELDLSTGEVSGWARALAPVGDPSAGGWDGWIELRGTLQSDGSPYGVSLNSGPTPSEFEGWAWGSDVIGWISFNRVNCDTDKDGFSDGVGDCPAAGTPISDYKVMTGISINNPPTAAISCNPSCTIYETDVLVLENNSTDPENNIVQSEWSTKVQGAGDPTYVVRDTCIANPLCDFTPQNWLGRGDYTARLIVEDAGSLSDIATINFSILRDITAGFMCSLDNTAWEVCEDIISKEGETVYFKDDSSLSEYSQASEGAVIISRLWEKDGAVFDSDNNTNPSITATLPSIAIKLTVTDSAGKSASASHTIGVAIPLPKWKEILPF